MLYRFLGEMALRIPILKFINHIVPIDTTLLSSADFDPKCCRAQTVKLELRLDYTVKTELTHVFSRNHSVGNKAKIKPAIRQLLEKEGYPYTEEGSGGILLVSFGTEGAPPTHTIPPKKPEEPKPQDDTGSGLLFAVLSSAAKFFFGLLCGGSSARAPEHNERNAPTDAPQQRENGQRSAPQSGQQDAGQSMAKS